MGLPGHRRTSSHKRRRASHFALKRMQIFTCPRCKKPVLPHMACRFCGFYAGRQVLPAAQAEAGKALKKAEKAKAAAHTHDHKHDHKEDAKKDE
jgi:large subunit ribosomal protein L32